MIKLNQLANLVEGYENNSPADEFFYFKVDNRELNNKSIFIVYVGSKFNPLDHIDKIVKSGCKYVAVENKPENLEKIKKHHNEIHFIIVKNIIEFTQKAGAVTAENFKNNGGNLIAISGSNGKTTTKEMLTHILCDQAGSDKVFSTQKNNNNHIGVPFTLFQADEFKKFGVIELGSNHPGEIEVLCKIVKPQFGITTNIGDTHLEFFQNRENVFKEEGILHKYTEVFFQNLDDEFLKTLETKKNWLTFGIEDSNNKLEVFVDKFNYNGKEIKNSFVTGSHNHLNLFVASLIATRVLKTNWESLENSIINFQPTHNRSQWLKFKDHKVFLDAYNANPSSMRLAIKGFSDYLGSIGASQEDSLLIIGDMNELGEKSDHFHQELGGFLNQFSFGEIYFVGRFAKDYIKDFHGKKITAEKVEDLADRFRSADKKYVFIKGSRSLQLETILDIR